MISQQGLILCVLLHTGTVRGTRQPSWMWAQHTARWTPTPEWWTAEESGSHTSWESAFCMWFCSVFPSPLFPLSGPWQTSSTIWSVVFNVESCLAALLCNHLGRNTHSAIWGPATWLIKHRNLWKAITNCNKNIQHFPKHTHTVYRMWNTFFLHQNVCC